MSFNEVVNVNFIKKGIKLMFLLIIWCNKIVIFIYGSMLFIVKSVFIVRLFIGNVFFIVVIVVVLK